jgi:hypothetical protein
LPPGARQFGRSIAAPSSSSARLAVIREELGFTVPQTLLVASDRVIE